LAALDLEVRPIRVGDRLRGLSLGDAAFAPLKTFLQRDALRFEQASLARTYGAFAGDPPRILGYITLLCGEVARLAVDQSAQGSGLGRALVNLALGTTVREICPAVGCRFVMVDAKKNAVRFYERCGFTMLDTPANRERDAPVMFVDLSKID
jgi:GNAT superfamily N-acetyltransferase